MASRPGLRSAGPADEKEAKFMKILKGLWKEPVDKDLLQHEAMRAKAGNRYDFKSPADFGFVKDENGRYLMNDHYVKMTSKGPVFQDPPRIHESSDIVKAVRPKKRSAAAEDMFDEHPRIEAAKDIHGYAPPDIIDRYHDIRHDYSVPSAGIPPEDRREFNKELQDFQRKNRKKLHNRLPDPIGTKRRKQQRKDLQARKAAAVPQEPTRRSDRVRGRGATAQKAPENIEQPETVPQPAVIQQSVPAQQSAPAQQIVPVEQSVPAQQSTPVQQPAVAKRTVAKRKQANMPAAVHALNKVASNSTVAKRKREAGDAGTGEKVKRPRINHACDKCREKKTRCDENKPCEACAKRKSECIYSDGPAPVQHSKVKTKVKAESGGPSSSKPLADKSAGNAPADNALKASESRATSTSTGSTSKRSIGTGSKSTRSTTKSSISTSSTRTPLTTATPANASSGAAASGTAPTVRQKRACDMCRTKKTRCDGMSPCEACAARGFTCVYSQAESVQGSKAKPEGGGSSGGPSGSAAQDGAKQTGSSKDTGSTKNSLSASDSAPGASTNSNCAGKRSDAKDAACQSSTATGSIAIAQTPGQKRKREDCSDASLDLPSRKRTKIVLHWQSRPAKLRSSYKFIKFDVLELAKIPENIQDSLHLSLQTKIRDLKIWELFYKDKNVEWNIDNRQQEESFHSRPAIKLVIPDHIKGLLVDDWEHVTKSSLLVELPHKKGTVQTILNDYLAAERTNREARSTQMDILEETIDGLREYFDKALSRILLYR